MNGCDSEFMSSYSCCKKSVVEQDKAMHCVKYCNWFHCKCIGDVIDVLYDSSSSSFGRDPLQMLAVMVLSQHHVSTSKTVNPRIPVGARCTGHIRIMCSAVFSAVPHLHRNAL